MDYEFVEDDKCLALVVHFTVGLIPEYMCWVDWEMNVYVTDDYGQLVGVTNHPHASKRLSRSTL